jgi:FkbM family methyltransferase
VNEYFFQRQLPMVVTLTDFDPAGVKFEVSNLVEHFRVVQHGGETEYTAAMLAELRADDVLYDLGANIGMVAVHAAKICPTIAFEPDPSIARRLEVNAELNDSTFAIQTIAVSDTDGAVDLHTSGDNGNSPSLVAHDGADKTTVTVPSRSLDSLTSDGRLPHPTVLKLDIEGAEILALRGAEQLLTGPRRPRALFIEVHDTYLPGFGSSSDEVYQLLSKYGYTRETYRSGRWGQTHLIVHAV